MSSYLQEIKFFHRDEYKMYKYEKTCLLLFEESLIKELSLWHGLCVGKDLPGQQANENNGSIPGQAATWPTSSVSEDQLWQQCGLFCQHKIEKVKRIVLLWYLKHNMTLSLNE